MSEINHPRRLVELYRKFYRAEFKPNSRASARGATKPFHLASQIIVNTDSTLKGQPLIDAIAARIMKLMQQCHGNTAEGYWVIADPSLERQAIIDFAEYLVVNVFEQSFNGDRARLQGRQLGYLEDACEFVYRLEQDKEKALLSPS